MKDKFLRLIGVAATTILLAACGTGSGQDNAVSDSGGMPISYPGIDKGSTASTPDTASPQQFVIRNGDMSLKVKDVSSTSDDIRALVASKGGRIESSSFTSPSDGRSPEAFMVARIPEAKLDEVISAVSVLGQRTSLNLNTSDVSLQVVDLKARTAALIVSRDRLLSLMAKATNTADLLAAEQALSQRQSELDSYQSQLDYLNAQVLQSNLNIQVIGEATSITSGLSGIKATFTQALRNFLQAFESAILFIGTAIPWVIIFIILYFLIRSLSWWVKKRTSRKQLNK